MADRCLFGLERNKRNLSAPIESLQVIEAGVYRNVNGDILLAPAALERLGINAVALEMLQAEQVNNSQDCRAGAKISEKNLINFLSIYAADDNYLVFLVDKWINAGSSEKPAGKKPCF